MIFDMNVKWVGRDKNESGKLHFYGHNKATEEEKRKLKAWDEGYYKRHNEHLITNYKDLTD